MSDRRAPGPIPLVLVTLVPSGSNRKERDRPLLHVVGRPLYARPSLLHPVGAERVNVVSERRSEGRI